MALFTGHTITPDSALGGTEIQRSLRFAGAAYNSISRTPSSTGNQKVWTWSCWFKRTNFGSGSYNYLLSSYGNNDGIAAIYFDSDNRINTYYDTSGSNPYGAVNERRYRDTTSWMHIVWQVDAINTTQKIWINGVEESLSSSLNPPNFAYTMNQSGQLNTIGGAAWYPEGTGNNSYLAEIHFSDGNKYTPSDFAYTDAQTGQWRPKNGNVVKSNLTYGTNGYWLDFRDNTSTTTLGYDYSDNGNHWTLNNMSVASGSDNDSVTDTPTNNFPILNPLDSEGNAPSDGNLRGGTAGTSGWRHTRSTVPLPSTGKWYWEYKVPDASADGSNGWITGLAYSNFGLTQDINSDSTGLYGRQTDSKYNNSSGSPVTNSHFTSPSNNDILQFAYDADSQTLFAGRNNTWELSANPSTGANPNWTGVASGGFPMVGSYGSSRYVIINFGQQPFSYTPPTGYASLSGHNRAFTNAAAVVKPQKHFDTLIWDGNSTQDRNITGLEFKPDMVWIKSRSHATYGGGLSYHHLIWDVLRGVGSNTIGASSRKELTVNQNYEEGRGANYTDYYGHVSSFNKDGFQLDHVSGEPPFYTNQTGRTYVAWCWRAGGAAVSNSDGSITSQVSVNQEAGFSVLTYTGTGSNATVGHGLGKAPKWVLVKRRNDIGNWAVYHEPSYSSGQVQLDTNVAPSNEPWWNGQATSSVINLKTSATVNGNTSTYVAYCWAEIPGFSKFGTYTGNGSSDGPFIHLGFRPAWFLQKKFSGSGNWYIFDNKRSGSNVDNDMLVPNETDAEYDGASYPRLDFLANGIKWRDAGSSVHNASGETYIYMAFAERPSETMFGLDANAR